MPGAAGPKAGEDLSHSAEVLFNLVFAEALSLFGKFPSAHAMCKKIEKSDGILHVRKVGFKSNAGAEPFPLGPVGTICLGITRRDSGFHCCPYSTVVSVHSSTNIKGTFCQDFSVGILC